MARGPIKPLGGGKGCGQFQVMRDAVILIARNVRSAVALDCVRVSTLKRFKAK